MMEERKGLSLVNADDEVPIICLYFLVEERSDVLRGHKKLGENKITFSFHHLVLDIIGRHAICAFKWTYAALRPRPMC